MLPERPPAHRAEGPAGVPRRTAPHACPAAAPRPAARSRAPPAAPRLRAAPRPEPAPDAPTGRQAPRAAPRAGWTRAMPAGCPAYAHGRRTPAAPSRQAGRCEAVVSDRSPGVFRRVVVAARLPRVGWVAVVLVGSLAVLRRAACGVPLLRAGWVAVALVGWPSALRPGASPAEWGVAPRVVADVVRRAFPRWCRRGAPVRARRASARSGAVSAGWARCSGAALRCRGRRVAVLLRFPAGPRPARTGRGRVLPRRTLRLRRPLLRASRAASGTGRTRSGWAALPNGGGSPRPGGSGRPSRGRGTRRSPCGRRPAPPRCRTCPVPARPRRPRPRPSSYSSHDKQAERSPRQPRA